MFNQCTCDVLTYWSCQLHKPEHGYLTIEKEALAVVSAIKAPTCTVLTW